jgi:hypothetical protein
LKALEFIFIIFSSPIGGAKKKGDDLQKIHSASPI